MTTTHICRLFAVNDQGTMKCCQECGVVVPVTPLRLGQLEVYGPGSKRAGKSYGRGQS